MLDHRKCSATESARPPSLYYNLGVIFSIYFYLEPTTVWFTKTQAVKQLNVESLLYIQASGLLIWLSSKLDWLQELPQWLMLLLISFILSMLTEFISNSAASSIFMPLVGHMVSLSTNAALQVCTIYAKTTINHAFGAQLMHDSCCIFRP